MHRGILTIGLLVSVPTLFLLAQTGAAPHPPFTAKQAELGKELTAKAAELQKQITSQDQWSEPAQPFKIMGNLYFVGPRYGEAFLLTSPQGHILIGAAMEKARNSCRRTSRAWVSR